MKKEKIARESEENTELKPTRGQKFKALIIKLYYDKRVRFLFVGGLNTAVGVGVEYLVYFLFGEPLIDRESISPEVIAIASVIAQVVGTFHSYLWNKFFTFRSKKKSLVEFVKFITVYLVSFGINYGLKMLFNNVWKVPMIATVIITLLISTLVSYFGHNFFSFRDKKALKEQNAVGLIENSENKDDDNNKENEEPSLD